MDRDIATIKELLVLYIKVIVKEYGDYIEKKPLATAIKNPNSLVSFDDSDSISFFVKNRKLFLPKIAYEIFPLLTQDSRYGKKKDNKKSKDDYLNTNTTYDQYIDYLIEIGATPIDFFKENLLHEAMHICGNIGGSPLEEGITELKTRELAMKYGIKISGYAYPKEVEVVKKIQDIFGKEVMDELAFIPLNERTNYLKESIGSDAADLYKKVSRDMELSSKNYYNKIAKIRNPYDKAFAYSMINYASTHEIINEYQNNKTR